MVMHGIASLPDEDYLYWGQITSLYINNFYSSVGKRAYEVDSKIDLVNDIPTTSTISGGVAVEITYSQTTVYRAQSSDVSVDEIIIGPFFEEADREEYVQTLKENGPSSFAALSLVSMPDLSANAPDAPNWITDKNDDNSNSKSNAGVIAGSLIGVFLSIILCCGVAFYVLWRRKLREETEQKEGLCDPESNMASNKEQSDKTDLKHRSFSVAPLILRLNEITKKGRTVKTADENVDAEDRK